ncbi:hypothetical protein Gotri_003089 [Gossypium trilobum]|uniref:Uncharacterized protein n=1 Tax=Gossypium trilobum TaxID=34281 RepID=A0A7J9FAA6_9ROSI|nr:hypothetical protein [Gossypium trilobum]
METAKTKHPTFKYLILSLSLSFLLLFLFISLHPNRFQALLTTTVTENRPPHSAFVSSTEDLKIRPGYTSYDTYIQRQLNKTLNPKLREIWTTRDWDRKIQVFSRFFADLKSEKFLADSSKCLCVGARVGQESDGVAVLHVSLSRRGDKYSANDLYSVKPLVKLFRRSKLVRVRKVDGFGLDTEVVFRKTKKNIKQGF